MNEKKKADVLEESAEADRLTVMLKLTPDLFWFKGHFPAQNILPGVVQLDWVKDFAERILGDCFVAAVPQMKFTTPMMPGDKVRLTVKLSALGELKGVRFHYEVNRNEQWLTASQGIIDLCR